jgi:outer membrane protein assembly factor BamB
MKSSNGDNSVGVQTVSPWYRSAAATAVVGAVFSVIILSLIVANYIRGRVYEARLEKRLENLKIEMAANPANEQALIEQIRNLDLQFRRSKVQRLYLSRTGGWLLLGSLAVFLVGAKCRDSFKKKMPAPPNKQAPGPGGDAGSEQIRQAAMARWSVTAALVLAGAVMLLLAIGPRVDFGTPGAAADSYPTPEQIRQNWHRFRGPGGSGVSAYTNVPEDWDGPSGRGILWKTKVPGKGYNSPVVWGDRVFLSGGDPNYLNVFCFDALSGSLLWTGDVKRAPLKPDEEPFEVMEDTGFAAPTVATDGKHVFAIFATGDMGCFDFNGRSLWMKNLGRPDNVYGYSASLEVYRNQVLIQYDQADEEAGKSVLLALDGASGKPAWQAKRPVANSWCSPILVQTERGPEIITASDPWVIAYEPNTGDEIWRAKCLTGDIAPSPIYAAGLVVVLEPYSRIVAVHAGGKGDVTKTHLAWSRDEPGPDICSPLSNGELLFALTSDGLLMCFKIADGQKLWEEDLRTDCRASPSLVGDKLYLLTEKGVMIIAEAGPQYKELARRELGEKCYASPAFVDGRIYIRGVENLYCLCNAAPSEAPVAAPVGNTDGEAAKKP